MENSSRSLLFSKTQDDVVHYHTIYRLEYFCLYARGISGIFSHEAEMPPGFKAGGV
jgi:hypothetical protein